MDDREATSTSRILRWSAVGKRIIAGVLMALMFLIVGLVTIEIVYATVRVLLGDSVAPADYVLLSEADLLSTLGLFLSVLIALELIETVEVYFREHSIHVEIVVLVAIIALARKLIILDPHEYSALVLFALGFLVLALGMTYYLVRKAMPAGD